MAEGRKVGRPLGSGKGYVGIATRVDPDVYAALEEWRSDQLQPDGKPMTQANAVRQLLRSALEHRELLEASTPTQTAQREALMQARAELHRALNRLWTEESA